MDWKTCFQGKKILVAEDDSINRELMSDILTQMQCQVDFAKDGNETVEKVSKGHYDLVFMDVRMPDKDGMQAAKEIRGLENDSKNVPILALTASSTESKEDILQSGMNDMVSKPINLTELREKMANVLLG